MSEIQQEAGNIPQRFCSILSWLHHSFCRFVGRSHLKAALLDWDLETGGVDQKKVFFRWKFKKYFQMHLRL